MIEVEGVAKFYGPAQALADVTFRVPEGEIVGLLGPNGAGKTTILKILTGYLQPDAGQVTVDGMDVVSDPRAAQARISYLPENAPVFRRERLRQKTRTRRMNGIVLASADLSGRTRSA